MNDDAKNVNQNMSSAVQADPTQPQVQVQPVASVGSVNKETAPVAAPNSEFIKPSEAEPQVNKELKEAGVEVRSDSPNLTPEHKELGIDHAGPSVPVSTVSASSIQYPMSEEEIKEQLKTGQDDSYKKWLARLIDKVIAWGFKSQ